MRKMASFMRYGMAGVALSLLILSACAEYAPVPGGSETVNAGFYRTKDDFLTRVASVTTGMSEKEALDRLGHQESEMTRLKRDEIVAALLGTSSITLKDTEQQSLLESLYGYRLTYKIVERKHGFTSPIRVRTDERGFNYAVTLIFRKGALYAPPIITGGEVNASSSRTLFDFFSPSMLLNK